MAEQTDLLARFLGATETELGNASTPRFRIFIRNGSFERIAELTEWTAFSCIPTFNDVGTWSLECSAETLEVSLLAKDGGIIVTREAGGVVQTVFSGFVWTEWGYTATTFRAAGYSDEALLWTPARPTPESAGPPFADDYDVVTGTASSVMIDLVNHNIGPTAAPAPWAISALRFVDDPLLGTTVTARANLQPLLTLLAELAITPYAGGLGFYLRQSDAITNKIEFGVYAPPDKSAEAKFSVDLGTALEYEDFAEAPEANHVYVMGGDGFGANRTIIAEQDDASIAEWGRIISTVIDRRGVSDPSELNQSAAEAIAGVSTLRRTAIVPFDVPTLQYGEDYDLGTLVSIVTRSGTVVDLIRRVEIDLDPERGPRITPIVGQGDGSDEERTASIVRTIQSRTSNLERNWNIPPDSVDASMLMANAVGPSELQASAVTEEKLDLLNSPADNSILTYDAGTARLEWQAINALAANLSITSLTVSGTSALGIVTASGAITGSSTVQGTRLISTIATGTAPLTVSSTTVVNNLNANYLEGFGSSDFATSADLADYLPLTGGAISGGLTVQGAFQADGNVLLGNAVGDTVVASGPLTVGTILTTPDLAVTDDAAITGDLAAGGNVHFTGALTDIDNDLSVDGEVDIGGGLDITAGGLGVSGSGLFRDALTVQDGLTVQTGGFTLDAGQTATFNGPAAFNDPVTFTDNPQVVGTDLDLSTAFIDYDSSSVGGILSSTAGFTNATFGGWVAVKVRGSIRYFGYYSSAPS